MAHRLALTTQHPTPDLLLRGVLTAGALLVVVAALQHLSPADGRGMRITEAVAALLAILAMLGLTSWPRNLSAPAQALPRRSTAAGLVLGLLWTVEIAMNNVTQPPLPLRDILDNVFWALVGAGILVMAVREGARRRSVRSGVTAGLWCGLATGAVACLTGLIVVVAGMPLLLADPLNIAEWADQGGGTAQEMATYFALETMAGAIGHLVVLGLAMGALLGVVGGVAGKVVTRRQVGVGEPERTVR
ncbi:hypothetical protein [Raineyella sp. LH-20]|uniref:hypothetical protein n=1 Tax=Raineyella sp. LH-20 TaxID=3081204 RepID=UPI002955949A|nr:hypothetical protein [Raineyella sp. LH-20]WOP20066.1 hypothetical protein R0146_07265 [Raineyella sp. LH-20]